MADAHPTDSSISVNRQKVRKKLYGIWYQMKARCSNVNNINYKYYGLRGITVCDRWQNSFAAFREDIGEPPAHNSTIDRIDNDRNYEPGNVRWATWKEQMSNRGPRKFGCNPMNVRLLTFQGRTQCQSAWARELGISESRLRRRIKERGIEKALSGNWAPTMITPISRPSFRWIEFKGETKTLAEWGLIFGINPRTLSARIKLLGMPKAFMVARPNYKKKAQ